MLKFGLVFPTNILYEFIATPYTVHLIVAEVLFLKFREVRRPLFCQLYRPWMIDEYRAIGGIETGRRNRNTMRKPAPVTLFPPQITDNLTGDRTRVTAVGSRRLTT